jgi:D-galactarolactone isomerase
MTHPMPTGACDCHVHVYDTSRPLAPSATFKPPHAPWSAYRAVQQMLGLSRAVLVQPTGYGLDNSVLLEALAQAGHAARAVVVLPADVSDAEVQRLHAQGVRGVRFMMLPGGVLPWDALPAIAARIAPLDAWTGGDRVLRDRVLSTNPAAFYGF